MKMKLAIGLLVVVGVGGAVWLFREPDPEVADSGRAFRAAGAAEKRDASPQHAADSNGPSTRVAAWTGGAMAVGDRMFNPKSDEDVAWLVRNGHPSLEQYRAALNMSPSLSNLHASDGISPVEIVHATVVATDVPGESDQAKAFLEEAAAQGSIYALHAMAEVLADPSHANAVQSEAYRRAAIMRGDWNASMFFGRPLRTREADLLASLMAQQILNDINARRRARGWPALDRDPRPGLDEFMYRAANGGGPNDG